MEPATFAVITLSIFIPLVAAMLSLAYVNKKWSYYVAAFTVILALGFAAYTGYMASSTLSQDADNNFPYQRFFAGFVSLIFIIVGLMFILYYMELPGGGSSGEPK
jgi:TRAP-type C4-dicarboxylate transport system permease small subunit